MEISADELKKFIESYGKPLNERGFKPLPTNKPVKQEKEERRLTPISDWCKHYALIFDDTGHEIGKIRIRYSSPTFIFNDFGYNFNPNETTFFKIKGFWGNKKYYFYNVNNPDGLILKSSGITPVINSKTYKAILENKLIEELNNLAEGGFMLFLKKYWWLILIIIGSFFAWYFLSGQNTPQSAQIINSTVAVLPKNSSFMTR